MNDGSISLRNEYRDVLEFIRQLQESARQLLPRVDLNQAIRSCGAVRPNPYGVENPDRSIGSFCVETPLPGFFSLIGIKTPGLTCANELGLLLAERTARWLDAKENVQFNPCRKAIVRLRDLEPAARAAMVAANPDYGEVVCLCEDVTKAEILQAIDRGAGTVDGVKRRTGCAMGRCQGGRCSQRIEEILKARGGEPG